MGPFGRAGRILLGGYLFVIALPYYLLPGVSFTFLGNTYFSTYTSVLLAFAITLGFLVFYLVFHYTFSKYAPNRNRWVGAALANIPLGRSLLNALASSDELSRWEGNAWNSGRLYL